MGVRKRTDKWEPTAKQVRAYLKVEQVVKSA